MTVIRTVREECVKKVPYTVTHMVPHPVKKMVPVTICTMVEEKCVKKVPYTVTLQEQYTVCKKVPYTVTEMVPTCVSKRVCVQVPEEVCIRKPRLVACEAPACPTLPEGLLDLHDGLLREQVLRPLHDELLREQVHQLHDELLREQGLLPERLLRARGIPEASAVAPLQERLLRELQPVRYRLRQWLLQVTTPPRDRGQRRGRVARPAPVLAPMQPPSEPPA